MSYSAFVAAISVPLHPASAPARAPSPISLAAASLVSTPTPPGQLAVSAVDATTAQLTFPSVPDATQYRIERGSGSGAFAVVATITANTANTTTHTDPGLTTGIFYRYRVSAMNSAGVSDPSPIASITPSVPTSLAAPQSLALSQPTPAQVALTWTGTTASQAVKIERSLDGGLTWTSLVTLPGSTLTYTDNVQRNTLYAYRLQASTFSATSPTTGSVAVFTPPPDVTAFQRTAITKGSASFMWSPSSGATGYLIEQSTESGPFAVVATIPGGTVQTTVTGLASGTQHQFRVIAQNAGGQALPRLLTGVLTIPAAPTAPTVVAIPSPISDGTAVRITVAPVKGTTTYVIERQSEGRNFAKLKELPASTLTFTDTVSITPGEAYQYRVKAVNESGDSEYSPEASIQISTSEPLPVPDQLSISAGQSNTVLLSWQSESAPGSYLIQRLVGQVWRPLTTATGSATSATLRGLLPGQSARVRVVAVTAGAQGTPSEDTTVTLPPARGTPPRNFLAPRPGQVTLIWRPVTGSTKWTLERSADKINFTPITQDSPVASYVDETVVPGLQYSYRVLSGNDAGYGPASAAFLVQTPPVAPLSLAATLVEAANPKLNTARLTWSDTAGELGYRIQASTDGTRWLTAGAARADATSATVRLSTFKFYRIAAFNRAGTSDFSPAIPAPTANPPSSAAATLNALATQSPSTDPAGIKLSRSVLSTSLFSQQPVESEPLWS